MCNSQHLSFRDSPQMMLAILDEDLPSFDGEESTRIRQKNIHKKITTFPPARSTKAKFLNTGGEPVFLRNR